MVPRPCIRCRTQITCVTSGGSAGGVGLHDSDAAVRNVWRLSLNSEPTYPLFQAGRDLVTVASDDDEYSGVLPQHPVLPGTLKQSRAYLGRPALTSCCPPIRPSDTPLFPLFRSSHYASTSSDALRCAAAHPSASSIGLTDHSPVHMLASRYRSVDFAAGTSSGSPNW